MNYKDMTCLESQVEEVLKKLNVGKYHYKYVISKATSKYELIVDFFIENLRNDSALTDYLGNIDHYAPTDTVVIVVVKNQNEQCIFEDFIIASEFHRGLVICDEELFPTASEIYEYLGQKCIDKKLVLLRTLKEFQEIVNFEKEKRDRLAKARNMFGKN